MKKRILLLAALILALSCVGCGNNAEIEALRKDVDELKNEIHNISNTQQQNASEQKNQTDNTSAPTYSLGAGDYEIPLDVENGKYDVICKDGQGVFNVHDSEKGYVISETMDSSNEYGITERKNANLSEGQTINITGTLKINLIKK